MSHRRILLTLLVSLVILVTAGYSYQYYLATAPMPTPTPLAEAAPPEVVSAEGEVVPARTATLGFSLAARVVEVRAAEGDVVRQGDVLARLDDAVLQKQIAQAEAAVAAAQKQFDLLKAGGTPEQLAAAKAAIDAANANYARVKQGPTVEQVAQLKANLDNARAAVEQAQAAYDRAGGASNPFIGQTAEALQLQQATNAYEAASAAYKDALAHPTEAELAAAYSQVQQAQEALARLTPTGQAIEVAAAQVAQAQAALELARAQAANYVLVAPFDGTVGTRSIEVGEMAQPGAAAFVLADLSTLRIETVDLAEVDLPRIKLGAPVTITCESFPGQTFKGSVSQIAPLASTHGGDKVFKVIIALTPGSSASLKWGMTTNVEIAVNL